MKPVTVTTEIDRPREEIYEHLLVLANHEAFCDHYLTDWTFSGPPAGVGAKVHVKVKSPGPADWLDITLVEVQPPARIVEETIGAKGKRRSHGIWTLEPEGDGRTKVSFKIVTEQEPLHEKLLSPLARGFLERGNGRALSRLREQLTVR